MIIAEYALVVVVEAMPVGWIATIIVAAAVAGGIMALDHGTDKLWDIGYSHL